jgi:6-phosphogluconolactonase (cycloisomerase 2 family)
MRIVVVLAALAAVVSPARAGTGSILYATAASVQRVDGFCIHSDGSLAPTASTQVDTAGDGPRRLVVGPNGVLYVAETDRVEAFRIGRRGGLVRVGETKPLQKPNMNVLDMAFSPDGTQLYVPQNGYDRLVAYPLDANGAPSGDFTSCLKGPVPTGFQRIAVRDGLLYATTISHAGRIVVYPIAADGSLPAGPADCGRKSQETCPLSERRKLRRPRAFVLDGDEIYVDSVDKRRIIGFTLSAGQFAAPVQKKTGVTAIACHDTTAKSTTTACVLCDAAGTVLKGPFRYQQSATRTHITRPYQDVVFADGSLLGSQFLRGRIDAFRLQTDGALPKQPTRSTTEDLRGSPVGLALRGRVLYVAGGELDRVQAFVLNNNGLPAPTPFSETDEDKNSFPNALAVSDTQDACE